MAWGPDLKKLAQFVAKDFYDSAKERMDLVTACNEADRRGFGEEESEIKKTRKFANKTIAKNRDKIKKAMSVFTRSVKSSDDLAKFRRYKYKLDTQLGGVFSFAILAVGTLPEFAADAFLAIQNDPDVKVHVEALEGNYQEDDPILLKYRELSTLPPTQLNGRKVLPLLKCLARYFDLNMDLARFIQ